MDRLHFGRRARRSARRKRIAGWLGALSVAGTAIGLPFFSDGFALVERVTLEALRRQGEIQTIQSASLRLARGKMETRPILKPTPSPSATRMGPDAITRIIYDAAAEFGIGGDYLLSVAHCESRLDPSAYNSAGYHGLFQFDFQTWGAYGYGNIYNPAAQARTAARLLAAGHSSRWPVCA